MIFFTRQSLWIYNLIPEIYSQAFNMERAEALVREMEEEGIDATRDIYHMMMDGYTMIKEEDKCLVVFKRLKVILLYFYHYYYYYCYYHHSPFFK